MRRSPIATRKTRWIRHGSAIILIGDFDKELPTTTPTGLPIKDWDIIVNERTAVAAHTRTQSQEFGGERVWEVIRTPGKMERIIAAVRTIDVELASRMKVKQDTW